MPGYQNVVKHPAIAASLGLALLAGCTVVNNGLPATGTPGLGASPGSSGGGVVNPAKVVHEGGIVYMAQKGLIKDRTDGFMLVGNKGSGYRTQAIVTGLVTLSEAQQADKTWTYAMVETLTPLPVLQFINATSKNRATASSSIEIPDEDISKRFRISVVATESVPAEAPAGSLAHRLKVELIKDAMPIRGEALVRRVYIPGSNGSKDREWRKITTNLDLHFELPGVPSMHGQPFVIKKIESNFIPQSQGDDLPLVEDEQQVWPDGTVLQQVLSRNGDLKGYSLKGTLIMTDPKRTPINFERQVDFAQASAMTTLRTLEGIVLELRYGAGNIFQRGELRDAKGTVLGSLKAKSANETTLTYPDGATESIKVD